MQRLAIAVCVLGTSVVQADDVVQRMTVQRVPVDLIQSKREDAKVRVGSVLFDDALCAKNGRAVPVCTAVTFIYSQH